MRKPAALLLPFLWLALVLPVIAASAAVSDLTPDQQVKYRQSIFDTFAGHLTALSILAQHPDAFPDGLEQIKANALALQESANLPWQCFTDASRTATLNNRAADPIWSDPAGFQKAQDNFKSAVQGVATIASTKPIDMQLLAVGIGAIGHACQDCHSGYRSK